MQVDFSDVDNVESFNSVPEGSYLCRVEEVRPGVTRDGNPRWAFRLEVVTGDHAGRTAAWDGMTWSERGLPRAKHVLEALGFDVSGTLALEPDDLKGRTAIVQVAPEMREDPLTGKRVVRMRVPFMGYQDATAEGQGDASEPSDVTQATPF